VAAAIPEVPPVATRTLPPNRPSVTTSRAFVSSSFPV
jgi:hypothetical protein